MMQLEKGTIKYYEYAFFKSFSMQEKIVTFTSNWIAKLFVFSIVHLQKKWCSNLAVIVTSTSSHNNGTMILCYRKRRH